MNAIQNELKLANSYKLEMIPETGLTALTRDNVARVEAMIQNDSAYSRSSDVTAAPGYNRKGKLIFGGSTAYWMSELKKSLFDCKEPDVDYYGLIMGAVGAVDRENSTHLNADNTGRNEITARIAGIGKDKLIDYLKFPDKTDFKLIKIISEKTHAAVKARYNLSFASKFCHYACFYLFEGCPEQDNYSIYDNVLKRVLPRYIKHYGINITNTDDYSSYREAVDKIRIMAGTGISRNGFDHLLWYYYKGRLD